MSLNRFWTNPLEIYQSTFFKNEIPTVKEEFFIKIVKSRNSNGQPMKKLLNIICVKST